MDDLLRETIVLQLTYKRLRTCSLTQAVLPASLYKIFTKEMIGSPGRAESAETAATGPSDRRPSFGGRLDTPHTSKDRYHPSIETPMMDVTMDALVPCVIFRLLLYSISCAESIFTAKGDKDQADTLAQICFCTELQGHQLDGAACENSREGIRSSAGAGMCEVRELVKLYERATDTPAFFSGRQQIVCGRSSTDSGSTARTTGKLKPRNPGDVTKASDQGLRPMETP